MWNTRVGSWVYKEPCNDVGTETKKNSRRASKLPEDEHNSRSVWRLHCVFPEDHERTDRNWKNPCTHKLSTQDIVRRALSHKYGTHALAVESTKKNLTTTSYHEQKQSKILEVRQNYRRMSITLEVHEADNVYFQRTTNDRTDRNWKKSVCY